MGSTLSPRSVMLSVLLGSDPPVLPRRALVDLCGLFGFRAGTIRTALSRMVASKEVELSNDAFHLSQRFEARRLAQNQGRIAPREPWDGQWLSAVVVLERRSMAERRAFRAAMARARMGELRPDVWLRPANLEPLSPLAGTVITKGTVHWFEDGTSEPDGPRSFVRRLWPLKDLASRAESLGQRLELTRPLLEGGSYDAIPETFSLSAEVVHYLASEPMLPLALGGLTTQTNQLRDLYDQYEMLFLHLLRSYFESRR